MSETMREEDPQRFFDSHYGVRATPLVPLAAGEWSRAYSFTLDGHDAVARFGKHRDDFEKDKIVGDLAVTGVIVPKVMELGDTTAGHFVVAERLHGLMLEDLDEAGMRAVLPDLLRSLDAIRDVDVSTTTGYGLWSPDQVGQFNTWQAALLDVARDEPGSRTAGWRAALEGSPTGAGPFDAALDVLRGLSTELPDERNIVHSDLLNNVLVDGDQITGIIDWGNAMYGDHLYDAAWLIYWWRWYPWTGINIEEELKQHWVATENVATNTDARLRAYQIHIGLGGQSYNAFKGRWNELAANAKHTLDVAGLTPTD